MKVNVLENYEALCDAVGDIIIDKVAQCHSPLVCFASGDTSLGILKILTQAHREEQVNFGNTRFAGLDEWVGINRSDAGSCRHTLNRHFFLPLGIARSRIQFFDGKSQDLQAECARMNDYLEQYGPLDFILLGVGLNGHIGFNEPTGSLASRTWVKILSEQTIKDNAIYFEDPEEVPRHVVTMGIATVMETRHCLLLANGAKKADAVRRMIEGPVSASCPASILQMHKRVTIVLDEEAAYLLTFKDHYKWVEGNKLDWQKYD